MDRSRAIDQLNHQLSLEHAAVIQYHHYAFLLTGIERKPYYDFFLGEAQEALSHMRIIGNWIVSLGGHPTLEASGVYEARDLREMLERSLDLERAAHQGYLQAIDLTVDDKTLHLQMEELARQEREAVNELEKILQRVAVA